MAKDGVPPGSQTSLREANRARVLTVVQQRGSITQVELAGVTGLSAATISNIVKELSTSGVLSTSPTSRSGRRAQSVTLSRNLGLVAGIHFSERSLRAMVADVTQRVIAEQRLPLPPQHRADSGLDRAAMLIDEMVESLGASMIEVLAIGVGLPAPVDPATGMVSTSGVLRSWDGVAVGRELGDRLGVQVRVENDANLGALAEVRVGAARGLRNVVYVRASHGLGMGLVVDGKVVHGRSGMAGELGHVILESEGVPCRCGKAGCLETTAGAAAMLAGLHPVYGHLALRDVIARAQDGDVGLCEALGKAGTRLGVALAIVCTLLDPEMVVVGGELAHAGRLLLGPLEAALRARTMVGLAGPVIVMQAALGDQSEVRGALALAVDAAGVVSSAGVP